MSPTDVPRSVWLVRHGQTDWNLARRYMSTSDRPLTPFGQKQAEALRVFFAPRKVDVIIHTGLQRTAQVAHTIAQNRNLTPICDEGWRETSHGAWEGLTYREVLDHFADNASQRAVDPANTAPPGGESLLDMNTRIGAAWQALGERYPNQRIVIVTHATPIQSILCLLTNVPLCEYWRWRVDLGSSTGIDCYPGTTILRAINVVPTIKRGRAS